MSGFRGVSIQASLFAKVEKTIKKLGTYRSVAEFVSESVRLRLEEYAENPKKPNPETAEEAPQ